VAALLCLPLLAACQTGRAESLPPAAAAGEQRLTSEHLRVQVIQTYPHDPGAFTQGLVFARGRLFESTGLEGRSSLREVELTSGKVLRGPATEPVPAYETRVIDGVVEIRGR